MKRKTPPPLILSALLIFAFASAALAQELSDARAALSSFPEAQAVLFINARRLINEAMPRVMPPAEYQKMVAEAQKVGFDVREIHYAVAGVRFVEPAPESGLPEFVVVVKGDFNADALLTLARLGLGTQNMKSRQETYGSKTLDIVNIEGMGKKPAEGSAEGSEAAKPSPYPEIAATAFDEHTLVVGVPAYVRATIDAIGGGQGRLKATTVELAASDPQTLWSLTAELPESLPQYLQKIGVPKNEEVDRFLGWIKQLSLSSGMDAVNFTMRAAILTDAPEHASAISGLVRMGMMAAESGIKGDIAKNGAKAVEARAALDALKTFTNRTEGNTVTLGFSVPQKTVADMVKKNMAKRPAARPGTKPRAGARRRATRRR